MHGIQVSQTIREMKTVYSTLRQQDGMTLIVAQVIRPYVNKKEVNYENKTYLTVNLVG